MIHFLFKVVLFKGTFVHVLGGTVLETGSGGKKGENRFKNIRIEKRGLLKLYL